MMPGNQLEQPAGHKAIWVLILGTLAACFLFVVINAGSNSKAPVQSGQAERDMAPVVTAKELKRRELAMAKYAIPYPEGRNEMSVSSAMPGPKASKLVADPFAPKKGEKQTWRLKAAYEKPIDSVEITFQLDNGEYPMKLKLVEGNTTDGWWEGTWDMPDSIEHRYALVVTLKSGDAVASFGPTFRDVTKTIFPWNR